SPAGLWSDGRDSFYFVENTTLRRLALSTGEIDSMAELPATSGEINSINVPPVTASNGRARVTGSGDDVYVADGLNSIVRVHVPTREATVFAGNPLEAGVKDGIGPEARLAPRNIWGDSVYLYILDLGGIRRVATLTAEVTTLVTLQALQPPRAIGPLLPAIGLAGDG